MNSIELLEQRIAPALLAPTLAKGVLTLRHDPASAVADNLLITQTAPGTFTVTDTGTVTNYTIPAGFIKSIDLQLGDTTDSLDFKPTTDGLSGFFKIATGGGGDTLTLESVSGTSGRIGGALTILGGIGADTVTLKGGIAVGGLLSFKGGGNNDKLEANNAFLGKVSLDNIAQITAGDTAQATIGALTVDNDEVLGAVTFIITKIAGITGSIKYCGTDAGPDNVNIAGHVSGNVKLMLVGGGNSVTIAGAIAGSLGVTAGAGDDQVTFTQPAASTPGATLSKNVSLSLGDGGNTLTLDSNSQFLGSLSLKAGKGADTMSFADFSIAKNLTLNVGSGTNLVKDNGGQHVVSGMLKYTGGADADTVQLANTLAGKLSIVLSNGINDVSGTARILGKTISIKGGTGTDTMNVGFDSASAKLTAKMGSGADTFTYQGGALASVFLDGGKDADTLNGASLLPAVQKIKNFETTIP
ncbi:MAG: hypothetical protein QOD99_668 [Chthoniobacter sp.]|jgi:hypothetical protein|nr:hypothetical protein [Chthoniobacter sp.]